MKAEPRTTKTHAVLLQTLLPPQAAGWVKAKAKRQGLSVAAWLRVLVLAKIEEKAL